MDHTATLVPPENSTKNCTRYEINVCGAAQVLSSGAAVSGPVSGTQQLRSGTDSVCSTAAPCPCSGLQQPDAERRGELSQSQWTVGQDLGALMSVSQTSNRWTF